ncbi:hypothetical protein GCM10029992_22060 [Glycomyces albus]
MRTEHETQTPSGRPDGGPRSDHARRRRLDLLARPRRAGHGRQVDLQLLALNDFHGNIEAGDGLTYEVDGEEVPAGGAEYLATHLDQAREGERFSTTVAAGDLIGASPFLSAAFGDEPTIESLNAMGVEVSSVGNHEFDMGIDALQRHIEGEGDYAGADFPTSARTSSTRRPANRSSTRTGSRSSAAASRSASSA